MQADRFTIKSQEALHDAITAAHARKNADVQPTHLLLALLDQPDGLVPAILRKLGVQPGGLRTQIAAELDSLPTLGTEAEPTTSQELLQVMRASEHEMRELSDEFISTEHLLLSLAGHNSPAGETLRNAGATKEQLLKALADVRGAHKVTDQTPEDKIYALEKFGLDLTAAGRERQARPGHRPRRRDPPRHPGPQPPHQEQPGPDRRARRRQDGDRRGPRPADRLRRRSRVAQGSPRDRARHRRAARRLQVPRRVRGAPQGRAQRGQGGARRRDPVPRRAAHDRRRRRRRGRGRRRQPAQADARPRRAARGRRDDA